MLELADDEGVHVDDVLVADASRRTTTLNAYVSGFGAPVAWCSTTTWSRDVPQDQVLSVVAHELGHAKHDDVLTGSLLGAAGLGDGHRAARPGPRPAAHGRPRPGNAETAGDPAVVPRVLALVAVAGLLASPVQNGISRRIETRADVDAVLATKDPAAFMEVQQQLATRSLADLTGPAWSQFWFGSHPTTRERIAVAGWLSDRLAAEPLAATGHVLGDRVAGVREEANEDALPNRNTAVTMTAAMPAISRPYSTAEAPRSSSLRSPVEGVLR